VSRILVWHGYLLSGSGSNIYTANLARVWRAAGHEVLLMCQDRRAHEQGFVDSAGAFSGDNARWEVTDTGARPARGSCTVVRPDIAALLPVYVYDDYEGFAVKRFIDLTEDELEEYTERNVRALSTALRSFDPDAVIVGHEIMGPFIALRACAPLAVPYLAKLHGSALEYAVRPQERYRDYAERGLGGARVVTGGSRYMVDEASSVVPGWEERAAVVNPGCDVELFRPAPRPERSGPVAGFVGKLIAAKGVHNLLAAAGLTTVPGLGLEIVGYGDFEVSLRRLARALETGDGRGAALVARSGGDLLDPLARRLGSADPGFLRRAAQVPVVFHGRLDHGPLSRRLPTFDLLVVPSVVPEAFGMVAAEAAACGVLPIVPRHSGIGEVGAALEEALGRPGLLTFDPAEPVSGIAAAVDRVLLLASDERAELERRAAALARERWSWERVADRLLSLATSSDPELTG